MRALDTILDLIYPPRCPFCRKLLRETERGICRACEKALPYVPQEGAIRDIAHVEICVAPLYYEGSVRESLLRYKFSSATAYKNFYAELIAKCIDENGISCDTITWAPISRKRLRKRGYDQARLIAEALAPKLGVPCVRTLAKTRNNPPQSSIGDAKARRANAAGVYRCTDEGAVNGKRILLIDDIVTTGATLSECAKILRAAGAREVCAAAVARSRR